MSTTRDRHTRDRRNHNTQENSAMRIQITAPMHTTAQVEADLAATREHAATCPQRVCPGTIHPGTARHAAASLARTTDGALARLAAGKKVSLKKVWKELSSDAAPLDNAYGWGDYALSEYLVTLAELSYCLPEKGETKAQRKAKAKTLKNYALDCPVYVTA